MASTQVVNIDAARLGRELERKGEISFDSMAELCAFVQHEIIASRTKYVKLAAKAEVCASTISKMAHGETHFPRANTVFAILRALGYEVLVRR